MSAEQESGIFVLLASKRKIPSSFKLFGATKATQRLFHSESILRFTVCTCASSVNSATLADRLQEHILLENQRILAQRLKIIECYITEKCKTIADQQESSVTTIIKPSLHCLCHLLHSRVCVPVKESQCTSEICNKQHCAFTLAPRRVHTVFTHMVDKNFFTKKSLPLNKARNYAVVDRCKYDT